MYKILLAACACLLPAAAPAQTSVQLYGIADAGVMWQRGSAPKVISGGAEGSRLGIKGSEQLARGMKAVFNLEARVELDTGLQVPTFVNDNQGDYLTRGMDMLPAPIRTAMAGLVTPLGAVLLGRMYTPGYEMFAAADAFEVGTGGTWGSITGGTAGFTALGADIRSQRALQYRVVLPSGLGGSLMVAGKGSGYLGLYDKLWGAALTYKAAGWDVGIGHNHAYDPEGAPSLRTTTVGGAYAWGEWKFFAGWDSLIAPRLAPLGAATAAFLRGVFVDNIAVNTRQDATSVQAGLQYRRGASRIVASLAHQDDRTASNSDATLFALGDNHYVSKRTDVSAVASFVRNDNEAQYSPATAGTPGGFTRAPGEDGRAFQLGMRHRF